jgi:flavodoxin I
MLKSQVSAKIGLFYGSTTGKTDAIAELIADELGRGIVSLHFIAEANKKDFAEYEYLIIGCPTWGIGELQIDWEEFLPELKDVDFKGKKVAYFGLGDQVKYPYNFLDAMGILAEKISSQGGVRIGSWSTDGYSFKASKALIKNQLTQTANGTQLFLSDSEFVGLGIDEDNQPELTEQRIKTWVSQIRQAIPENWV